MINDKKLLARIIKKKAVIISDGVGAKNFIALPFGDKRRRPIAWLDEDTVKRLLASGTIVKQSKAYVIASSYKKRVLASNDNGAKAAFSAQHQTSQKRNIYNPDGLQRAVRIYGHVGIFRRLAKQKDSEGNPFLLADEIEAGERFAKDYERSLMGAVSAQNYSDVKTNGGAQDNTAENIAIMTMDAKKRVTRTLDYLGPGLDRPLIAICGREWSMKQLEAAEKWPRGSGKTVLKLALSRLSSYYGCRPGEGATRTD